MTTANVITLSIFFLVIIVGWRYPMAATALATQSYVIRYAFVSPIGAASSASPQDYWGILFPLAAYGLLLLALLRRRNIKFPTISTADILLALLVAALVFSSTYAPNPWDGLERSARFIALAYLYYIFVRIYLSNTNAADAAHSFFLTLWFISTSAAVLALILQTGIDRRLTLGAAHPIPFGMLIASGLLINYFWLTYQAAPPVRLPKFILFITILLLLYVFIASNNRGPFISWIVSMALLLGVSAIRFGILHFSARAIGRAVLILISSIMSIAAIAIHYPKFVDRLLGGVSAAILAQGSEKGQSALERLDAWRKAWELFASHPMLGVGTGGFQHYHFLEYPHNIILEISAENGILGLVILLALIAVSVWEILLAARRKAHPLAMLAASLTLLNLAESQVSFTLWMHKGWLLSLALLIALNRVSSTSSKNKPVYIK